ncbi:MAG TPA: SpvB/TcaC N-terminal domain-containing protein [Candidatus Angelobacter sp.]|jgi:RHS repeat-associated protein
MADEKKQSDSRNDGHEEHFAVTAPQLNLPKGGGAIRGIGEKFAANPVTGTGSLTVPIYASHGRSGVGPQLSLSYDSGAGNGPFGFGWSLAFPSITRKTDKGLPRYQDADESDTFILSGAEDLVPQLSAGSNWVRDVQPPRLVFGKQYGIHQYRPRVEGLFARIERWINLLDPTDTFWRSISKDDITTWYGKTAESRIADPSDPSRVFCWLICESYDDKGNVIVYQYKPEDAIGVDLTQAHERNRSDADRSAKRHIKSVLYGNRTPYFPDLTASQPTALPVDWCFQLVFDYGEHDLLNPVPQDTGQQWLCRIDASSTYRSTFEIRNYRLCRRALMFHHFAEEPNIGLNCLVRSTGFLHSTAPPTDSSQPFYSYLLSVTQTGYVRNGPGYFANSLPPLQFEYTEADVDETVRDVDSEAISNLPYGIDGNKYRWVDLNGEGLSGVLTEQGGSWFYKPNLSPVNQQTVDGEQLTLPRFGAMQLVARQPSLASLSGGRQQLMDLSGNGRLDLVEFDGPTPGFFERTEDSNWEPFQTFGTLPVLDWRNPNLKFIDLTGDGFPDLLISEDDAFWWHTSLSTEGFGPAQRVAQSLDAEKGPQLVFSDGTESIFLADMSGDGLTDLVRVRLGEVCYWPNLGYGRFGAKVTMDQSPRFDRVDVYDGRRIHLADIDGSGTADIIYFAAGEIRLYFNQSGNAFGAARALRHFPSVDSLSSAMPLDLLGNGTACLVWSSPLAGNARRPMRYIDLMGGQKPHLMVRVNNNLGAETLVQYAPSTKFYVADKLAGTPWLTRLPFPVQVVERVESYDYVSRNRFVTRYAYHHGYFDGVEREFRGFGRVDQWDTEEFTTLSSSGNFPQAANEDPSSAVPPIWTKTWFHTGAFFVESAVSRHFEQEYYSEGNSSDAVAGLTPLQLESMLLDDTVLPIAVLLPDGTRTPYDFSGEELREACRALRGSILRQEIYALDDTDASDRPYSVSERNYTIEVLQPQGPNQFGVFLAHPRETIEYYYERKLYKVVGNILADRNAAPPNAQNAADPRVTHAITLAIDPFGNVLQSVAIGYGRRYLDPGLTPADQTKQSTLLSTLTENLYTNAILEDDAYRAPLSAQSSTYELVQFQPAAAQQGVTNLFRFDEIQVKVSQASDGAHDLPFENLNPAGLNAGKIYRRLLDRMRTLYRPDDMGAAAGDPNSLLALGKLESLALPGSSFKLAFTPGLISQVYQRGSVALLPDAPSVLGSVNADGGGYLDLDGNGDWWAPSGHLSYFATATTSAAEKAEALQHFFMPRRFVDPFGNATTIDYDPPHDLLVVKTTDAAGNTADAANDYRVLAPALLTDPNGNRAAVSFDALGMVAGTAVMGKTTENLGDSITGFSPDLTQAQIDSFYAADDPHSSAADLLGNATTRIVYDVLQFLNSRTAAPNDSTKWLPVFAATIVRETHVSDLTQGQQSKTQITFSYSDGFGREIQKKIQAEPGPVVDKGPIIDPRWVGSGWTIFNNKGKPIRQYEPFFSQLPKGHQFEFGIQVGVSPILCYDPVERVVATVHPNHTYEKVVFDPWHQETWDVNDTVLQIDPTADPDVGDFFQLLPNSDYSPTWYAQRNAGGLGPQEQDAATKTAAHANTPSIAYFDTLGRPFLTLQDNGGGLKFPSRVELDIQGNQRSVRDAIVQAGDQLGRIVMRYDYDMLNNHIHQSSMEAGERWMLNDVAGKPIRAWDSRGHNFRTAYDALHRPTALFVLGTDATNSDPRTTTAEVLYESTVYGESQPTALNLNTRIFQHRDAAGILTSMGHDPVTNQDEAFDFKGNLLRSSRQFLANHKALPNWSATPALLPDVFTTSTQYDALNRPIAATTPDGSIVRPTYNEANLLETVNVNLRGAANATPFITNIDYDAKGQRVLIAYGNSTQTNYSYDPETFRLVRLTTTRLAFPANQQIVQDLTYSYDPAGNITHIQDDADIQNAVFFRNQRVEPSADYTYDAIYRLIQASGREQLGLGGNVPLPPTAGSYNDVPRILLTPAQGDGNAVGTYTEQYQYDVVGNFLQFIHRGASPSNPGWTRSYTYSETSLVEPGKMSNRLSSTAVSGSQSLNEPYFYDLHGNMTSMPQLQAMQWDFKDELLVTQRQAVNASDADGILHQAERTYYVYDSFGQRFRKVTESAAGIKKKERFYLGGFEVYREYDAGGTVTLERETLHVMDDKKRVALVETRTQGTDPSPAQLMRYQFSNHLGSASLELDDAAQIISYEEYCPYGNTSYQAGRSAAEVSLNRYRYSGKERDEENGLYYFGARYYASWLGRWTAAEPLGLKYGPNLYVFVGNQPVNHVEADGRGFWDVVEGIGEGLLVAAAVVVTVALVVAIPVAGPIVAAALTEAAPALLAVGVVATAKTISNWVDSRSSSDPEVRAKADRELGRAFGGWMGGGAAGSISKGLSGALAADEGAVSSFGGLRPAYAGASAPAAAAAKAVASAQAAVNAASATTSLMAAAGGGRGGSSSNSPSSGSGSPSPSSTKSSSDAPPPQIPPPARTSPLAEAGGATRPVGEMLRGDSAAVRELAMEQLHDRVTSGEMIPDDVQTMRRLEQEKGIKAVVKFNKTGKLPKDFELSHYYSKAANPEVAKRPDLAKFEIRDDHIQGTHGGDTRVPLYGNPRNPDYKGSSGFQIIDANTPEGRGYLGMSGGITILRW